MPSQVKQLLWSHQGSADVILLFRFYSLTSSWCMETQIVAFINGACYLGSKLIQMSHKEQWGWDRDVCSLLVFSDWLISLLYERLKGLVPWGLSVVITLEPGCQQLRRGSCIHTLHTHRDNTETVLGGDLGLEWQLLLWRVTGNWVMHFLQMGHSCPCVPVTLKEISPVSSL